MKKIKLCLKKGQKDSIRVKKNNVHENIDENVNGDMPPV
jgi:hypothetical protein